jgi:hypothetical protein
MAGLAQSITSASPFSTGALLACMARGGQPSIVLSWLLYEFSAEAPFQLKDNR